MHFFKFVNYSFVTLIDLQLLCHRKLPDKLYPHAAVCDLEQHYFSEYVKSIVYF